MIKVHSSFRLFSFLVFVSFGSIAAEVDQSFVEQVNDIELIDTSAMETEQGFVILKADDLEWDEDGADIQQKVIYGDPTKAGLYILRARFSAGVTSVPHFHSTDRFVTVIEGTWYAGTDASHDIDKTTELSVGGFMIHPAGAVHFDGSRDGPVIVEIRGMGPVITEAVAVTR
ncbi:cupin domain-containing protein [Haliea sp. AH-315-K21]|uniref:Uncharacterized protein n=1 Tax=SAR86 cluster bacterium TaxID=2030880 RepID=A0A2A5CBL0_9GAMM|nr:cupin domain-containing protein [Haliea sp. AH-315-K21]MBN4075987.1 cupin domain-containing protein [Gammaproteobacteria bacterium AH-315-E17]PCJ41217.1 MAG: hypothetical protein COA71_09270 [SAR86 cluster bacterium]